MATVPRSFQRTATAGAEASAGQPEGARMQEEKFLLRPLPHEDVYFYCKKIDNSRLVREADPQSRGACWSAIGAASLALVMLTAVLAPGAANTLAGYRIEALRVESRRLADERRQLEVRQAELLSPERLEQLAQKQNLVTPTSSQVVHLDGHSEGAVAMVKH